MRSVSGLSSRKDAEIQCPGRNRTNWERERKESLGIGYGLGRLGRALRWWQSESTWARHTDAGIRRDQTALDGDSIGVLHPTTMRQVSWHALNSPAVSANDPVQASAT